MARIQKGELMAKQYYFKHPVSNEVYGYSSDEISKNPQLMNGLIWISEAEMKKLTTTGNVDLESAKAKQLAKVIDKFKALIADESAVLTVPGVGQVNASKTDLENVTVLLDNLIAEGGETTLFRLYDNTFKEVSIDDLRIIKNIIGKRGIELYNKKWQLEYAIQNATTVAEVAAVTW